MPWTVEETTAFTKQYSKAGLQRSEETKYQEWRGQVPEHGGIVSSPKSWIQSDPSLRGADNQWELYIGAAARISFTTSTDPDTVTLVAVGHT